MAFLGACAHQPSVPPSEGHIGPPAEPERGAEVPPPVRISAYVPPPQPAPKPQLYSVVVRELAVKDILFALARDAKLNADIHPKIDGVVTINAIDQTLPQILDRIAKQVDIRYEMDGQTLTVLPDEPYLKTYKVDYVSMTRDSQLVSSTGGVGGASAAGGGSSGGGGGNISTSTATITSNAKNHFWDELEKNLSDILKEGDKDTRIAKATATYLAKGQTPDPATAAGAGTDSASASGNPVAALAAALTQARSPAPAQGGASGGTSGSGAAAASSGGTPPPAGSAAGISQSVKDIDQYANLLAATVISNRDAGVLMVRANSRQQAKVQSFLDQVQTSVKRQVLIEATIVEVRLNDAYQAGIDWSRIASRAGFTIRQSLANVATAGNAVTAPISIAYANAGSKIGNISGTLELLEQFGNTRVLSSPKIMALNNQTALLKVVDNRVYFTIRADTTANQATSTTTFTTTPNTVPIGFMMHVTPQIDSYNGVMLNIRPTITRLLGSGVRDPNPSLALAGVVSIVPEVQTREFESMLRAESGQTVILGGLMQDDVRRDRTGVPVVSRIPVIGEAFSFRDEAVVKTELVIFLRPTVINSPSLESQELRFFQRYLPQNLPSTSILPGADRAASKP